MITVAHILVLGAGRIGTLCAHLLKKAKYRVELVDALEDITQKFIEKHHISALVSCLPYFLTYQAFQIAARYNLHYFDVTEDVASRNKIKKQCKKNSAYAIVPHCGLAPGWVGILAHHLAGNFDRLTSLKLRVGGLPQYANNDLQYGVTWSVDGLINGYGNPCEAIEQGKLVTTKPLEDVESLEIDGMLYEAFNTSGGIGNLIELYQNKVTELNYKTIRYPGHAQKMFFLMNTLKLNENRKILKEIMENALPIITQDVVIIDVCATGYNNGRLIQENSVKKYYPRKIGQKMYSALQITTAASLCAVIDVVLRHPNKYKGFVFQETIDLDEIKKGVFSKYL
jgi:saccharopine dehydrogenase-like NADP-dependent oxidoreductase